MVLVTVLLAAFLISKFVQRAGTELMADARASDEARLRRSAYSALETTLAVLADVRLVDQALYSPAQGWGEPLEYAGYEPEPGQKIEVTFEDESGRLSLPRADAPTLVALFESMKVDRALAERASDALLVWMHKDYVPPSMEADPAAYERAAIPHTIAGRPLRSYAELASIAIIRDLLFDENHQPNERMRAFMAAVSLHSFEKMNLNSATPGALEAAGFEPAQITALQDHLHPRRSSSQLPYFKTVADAAAAIGVNAPLQKFGVEIQALRVTVTVHDGGRDYRVSTVVTPPGGVAATRRDSNQADQAAQTANDTVTPEIKKLDYPFKLLEVSEDVESGPATPEESKDS